MELPSAELAFLFYDVTGHHLAPDFALDGIQGIDQQGYADLSPVADLAIEVRSYTCPIPYPQTRRGVLDGGDAWDAIQSWSRFIHLASHQSRSHTSPSFLRSPLPSTKP